MKEILDDLSGDCKVIEMSDDALVLLVLSFTDSDATEIGGNCSCTAASSPQFNMSLKQLHSGRIMRFHKTLKSAIIH